VKNPGEDGADDRGDSSRASRPRGSHHVPVTFRLREKSPRIWLNARLKLSHSVSRSAASMIEMQPCSPGLLQPNDGPGSKRFHVSAALPCRERADA